MKYLILLLLITSTLSCDKSSPSPTDCNDNCNYMTCTINSVPWTASCEGDPLFGCDPVDCLYWPGSGQITITCSSLKPESTIKIVKNGVIGGIKLGNNALPYQQIYYCHDCVPLSNTGYFLDTLYNLGKHIILDSIDTKNRSITGKFDFRAITLDYGDTVYIKNGTFQLTYRN